MVVKDDGTKWACQSCLKGHRVSGCTHTDRELFFVPKKGRPVTQCPHCRAERKKRSSHVKCDCGEKPASKEKCIHLREAEAKAAAAGEQVAGVTAGERHSPELTTLTEESSPADDHHHCCCPHGGKCTCATLKKEPHAEDNTREVKDVVEANQVKEIEEAREAIIPPSKPKHQRSKPRLTSHQSEGHLTVFANGHHKPCHRNNNAAHESGAPYKLPRSHTTQALGTNSRHSIDSLASVASGQPQSWFHSTVSNQPQQQNSPTTATQISTHPDTRVSPDSQPQYSVAPVSSSVPSALLTDFGFPSASSVATTATEASMPAFPVPSSDINMNNEFWSNLDWSKIDSNTFDSQPALTNTSSGTISEIDELPATDDLASFDAPYAMNMQTTQLGYANNNTNNNGSSSTLNNFDLDFSVPSNESNRWSMPVYQNSNTSGLDLSAMTADSFSKPTPKQPVEQSMAFNQYSPFDFQQPNGSELSSSVQSQSPGQSSFPWDQSIFDYAMAGNDVSGVNGSMPFSMADSTGPSVAPTAAPSPKYNADGDNDGFTTQNYDFDDGTKMIDWTDGALMPASQGFLNTYNYDQNFSTSDFSNGWTS